MCANIAVAMVTIACRTNVSALTKLAPNYAICIVLKPNAAHFYLHRNGLCFSVWTGDLVPAQ